LTLENLSLAAVNNPLCFWLFSFLAANEPSPLPSLSEPVGQPVNQSVDSHSHLSFHASSQAPCQFHSCPLRRPQVGLNIFFGPKLERLEPVGLEHAKHCMPLALLSDRLQPAMADAMEVANC